MAVSDSLGPNPAFRFFCDFTRRAATRRGLERTPLEYIRDSLLVTTSGNWYEAAFLCTLLALGADKILFAVDCPTRPTPRESDS